jgi:hypothetical protein
LNDFNDFEQTINNNRNEIENSIKSDNEVLLKLDIERNILYSSISAKEREINEMEFLVLQRLPSEFANFEFLFNKEVEIHNKMKMENNSNYNKSEKITAELKDLIKVYKEISLVDLDKTKEGYLKVSFFKNIKNSNISDGAYIIVEIKEGSFQIISYYPQIKISTFEEELQNSHNFTLFLTKIALEFLKFIKN